MKELVLHLKKRYWDQIATGDKTEEYRLETPYWKKRLENRSYDSVVLCCGYPSRDDKSRRIVRPWHGVVRKTITHPHFSTEPVRVFAIRLTRPGLEISH